MNFTKFCSYLTIIVIVSSCASYKAKYTDKSFSKAIQTEKELVHSFYLIGDAGNAKIGETIPSLTYFQKELANAPKNSTTIFLGDNIYPYGMPGKESSERVLAEHRLQTQIDAVQDFKGKTIFIPGNHDWYNGVKGLKRQEKMVEKALGDDSFLPENGCGLKKVNINDDITLIIIDSRWFIADWNKHPTINENCDIKTREHFIEEVSSLFKKNRYKNVVVAVHHPLYSNGPHGGSFSVKDHMKPLPILGTFKNALRSHAGIQTDIFNKNYSDFVSKIQTIADDFSKNVVFVSGHEHNLQYIEEDGFKQVISGSGSKESAALIGYGAQFTYGNHGYAKLNYYKDGSAIIEYYSANTKDGNKLLFNKQIIAPRAAKNHTSFPEYDEHKEFVETSIYPPEATKASGFHKFMWGDLHREKYGKTIKVPVLELEKVFGGLQPIRRGGGNQTNSLRLENPEGKQFVLRSMVKDGSRIMGGILKGTFLIDLVQDIFTMSHPYAAFVIPDMAEAVNIYHTNPRLYYMPKQPALGQYNEIFGGGLYLLEERPAGDRSELDNFGNSEDIISTFDVLEKIRKNGKHSVDQEWAIRSRLFDMVIGDWDRHEDQWRWASFRTEDGKTYYRPIPRDRDQPFSKFDGVMIPLFQQFAPLVKNMQTFDYDIKNMKWYNNYPRFFDTRFLNELTLNDWYKQAEYIQQHLTDEVIEKSIQQLPKSVYDIDGKETITKIKARRNILKDIAKRYYTKQAKTVHVIGTDKDDKFIIKRLNDDETSVTIYRKGDEIYNRTFNTKETKEIQLYGLNGDDEFLISGNVNDGILLRIIGGQDHDVYTDKSSVSGWSKKTKIYDYKSKKNTVNKSKETADLRSDSYFKNTYNHRNINNNTTVVFPSLGSNPDDGFFFGASLTYTQQGFKKTPFANQHTITANHYSSTNGYDIEYNGEFTELIGSWSLNLYAKATSDNYSFNFFGWGNESVYNQSFDLDYYRVKKEERSFSPSLLKRLRGGSIFKISGIVESIEIEDTPNRFINNFDNQPTAIFDVNYFWGGELNFNHNRVDNLSFPTKGMNFDLAVGAKANADDFDRRFGYIKSSLAMYQNLVYNRSLVFASEIGTHVNIGNRFEVYQAATLGGERNLRGFNRERFSGNESFYHSNDLRLRFGRIKTGIIPMKIGVTGGFDYGRVWSPYSPESKKWHTSYGGSLWLSGIDLFTANVSYFKGNSSEDRIAFTIGFSF
ncbi:ShlB/FhaC/HecB family hemolysin secretion/activation protein [Tenacibaculum caenipelagi]|uniref:Calcineurin-like phosphoesterase family protein n=1 Tax=Tenacibaculum caenipelagi TaxID=1325435 RepID=A0A4R6TAD7_9FLAO|nr:metallophosphoesterase [Tenacibaculum caenipelagi]TDQ21849.1 calcineurin-like phosphoesterase family protein [Tenacibaculum caenipelagi]